MNDTTIKFYANCLPPLKAGDYQISIQQKLSTTNVEYKNDFSFEVKASTDEEIGKSILTLFPEHNSNGKYSELLPQITFQNKSLPWEQSDGDKPWIWLLLLRDGEQFTLENNQLSLSKALYESIAPSEDDLKFLAHVREEEPSLSHSTAYKINLRAISTENESPKLSFITCNRLPGEGLNTIFLVSNPVHTQDKTTLNSYKKWNFINTEKSDDIKFSELLKNIEVAPYKLNVTPQDTTVAKAIELGFVPMKHTLRNGDTSVSFYRGPFVPFKATFDKVEETLSADSAILYNAATGMFDESYAAAFQLGKLLALQNKTIAQLIFNQREERKESLLLGAYKENAIADFNTHTPLLAQDTGEFDIDLRNITNDFESIVLNNLNQSLNALINLGK
jgi:hypothetical protein